MLDMRSFRENSDVGLTDYCQKNGITDVLFLNGIMSANNQQILDGIEAMLD